MKAHYCTNFVEGGRIVKGDVLIEERTLNEVLRYV